ncbi:metallophosphoesterase family protein [Deinococcus ficus]|uniref:Metallophosphatase family protein n=1 Tax=Deinococcus ficus TaxID=317577 RepID=A0A221STS4_9DEIO|nr:metallophosphoesterase family protein [Deinococcus ficus]ASN80034.1 metallophosphatase family protein [Deinococcus ficus]
MRLAVLGDVHGNAFALEAVLADVRSAAPDALFNLGDTVWGGADPARAWALQQEFAPPTVRGNTDETLAVWHADRGQVWQDWLRPLLPAELPARLGALPTTAEVAGGEVLLAHGTPHSAWTALFSADGGGVPLPPREIAQRVQGWPGARVVVVGHTHTEQVATHGGVTFVNAGSVSRQPRGTDPHARWVLLERRAGAWNVTFRRVPYDTATAACWARQHCPLGEQEAALLLGPP